MTRHKILLAAFVGCTIGCQSTSIGEATDITLTEAKDISVRETKNISIGEMDSRTLLYKLIFRAPNRSIINEIVKRGTYTEREAEAIAYRVVYVGMRYLVLRASQGPHILGTKNSDGTVSMFFTRARIMVTLRSEVVVSWVQYP